VLAENPSYTPLSGKKRELGAILKLQSSAALITLLTFNNFFHFFTQG
jgi:hypothetical protein